MEERSWRSSLQNRFSSFRLFNAGARSRNTSKKVSDENGNARRASVGDKPTSVAELTASQWEFSKAFHEDPRQLQKDTQTLRNLIQTDPNLTVTTDDKFLLRFLRSMDYDCEGAFHLIQKYYRLQLEHPEIYVKIRPSEVLNAFTNNMLTLLPHRDQYGRCIFIYKTGVWDPIKCPVVDGYRGIQLCLEMAVRDEETQKNGVIIITDWKGFALRHAKYFRPSYVKIGVKLIQECFPARFVAFHIVNEHSIFEIAFMIIKPFLREETKNRMYLHGSNWESLHEYVDPSILPVEYGGTQPPVDNSNFIQDMMACDDEFFENSKFGYTDTKDQKHSKP